MTDAIDLPASDLIFGIDAVTGEQVEPGALITPLADVGPICEAAWSVFDTFRALPRERRASLLDAMADEIEGIGEPLIVTAMRETGLPRARLEGERGRTTNQLRLFAEVVRRGDYLERRHDPALPQRTPPRPDLRMRKIPLGPVAVFAASNFPLAFSVAGGDTASALAAGCPVVVKAHPAHPGVSRLVADAVGRAVQACELPHEVFAVVFEAGFEAGLALVSHSAICAVGFTGSRSGGRALMAAAAARDVPIPVYAEMSSINPVVLLPGALSERGPEIGVGFAAALTLGSGQFCTNPGLVVAIDGPELDRFIEGAAAALQGIAANPMLTKGIRQSYRRSLESQGIQADVVTHVAADAGEGNLAGASLRSVSAATFIETLDLHHEVFGPASLLVRCRDEDEICRVLESLEGQLTAAVHIGGGDERLAAAVLPILERKAGRILANGFGTGVEVASAMVHGGPWPATSDGRSTSVGTLAIDRFLRPISYQDWPQDLLPNDFAVT